MNQLYVYHNNSLVGLLNRDKDFVYSFSYSQSWLKDKNKFALSLTLPLSNKLFSHKETLSFFENLIPEGEIRRKLYQQNQIESPFDFIKLFGEDCAGAVTISADSKLFLKQDQHKPQFLELKKEKIFSSIANNKSISIALTNTKSGYLSLAGAQDKFPAVIKNNKFYLPLNGYPTTHIVKLPIIRDGIKDSVYNEFFCMELARAVGLNVPKCSIIDSKYPLYIIERFDRKMGVNKEVTRIHQQDFCQAQGFTSEQKYESNGGPSLISNYNLLLNNTTSRNRISSLNQYLNWICFNLLIGNNDCHSKNLSLLFKSNQLELSPFYDLLCTAIYPSLIKEFPFTIGDRNNFSMMGINQFHDFELSLKIKKNSFVLRLKKMMELIQTQKNKVGHTILEQHPRAKIVQRINLLIAKRIKSLMLQGIK